MHTEKTNRLNFWNLGKRLQKLAINMAIVIVLVNIVRVLINI